MNLLDTFSAQQIPSFYLDADQKQLQAIIREAKASLGDQLLLLAHHYQKDEVVDFADEVGDSLQLAQLAAKNKTAEHIVFCGVHFMAETADMLTEQNQHVYLPDPHAGCSMADMADPHQLQTAWDMLDTIYPNEIMPITYVNSSAAIKAFVGRHGGAIVTSSNAEKVLKWAFTQKKRIFFLPDQHLGRNTAYHLGIPLEQMALWDQGANRLRAKETEKIRVILWNGWCSVHQQFTVDQIDKLRKNDPDIKVIVHPECPFEVVQAADDSGSTNKIMNVVKNSPKDTHWAVGTDHNLVTRMKARLPQKISLINPVACACLTMNRIRLPHLAWTLDSLANNRPLQPVTVDPKTTGDALRALDKMLALS